MSTSDEAISAYNIANYGGNKDAYQDSVTKSEGLPSEQFFDKNKSKFTNENFVEEENSVNDQSIATQNASPKTSNRSEVISYPFDLNPKQDHFKIMRYNYIRPDINMSKGPDKEIQLTSYSKPSNSVRKNKNPVTLFLVNGVNLQGVITLFDNFSVLLRREGTVQLVFKHAISTIMPSLPIDLLGEDSEEE